MTKREHEGKKSMRSASSTARDRKARSLEDPVVKRSYSFPKSMYLEMEKECKSKNITKSLWLQKLVKSYFEKHTEDTNNQETEVTVSFNSRTFEVLATTAKNLGFRVISLIQLIVQENLADYVDRGQEVQKKLQELQDRTKKSANSHEEPKE